MGTHSSILAWKIPWTESLVGYSPWGCKKLNTTERLTQRLEVLQLLFQVTSFIPDLVILYAAEWFYLLAL